MPSYYRFRAFQRKNVLGITSLVLFGSLIFGSGAGSSTLITLNCQEMNERPICTCFMSGIHTNIICVVNGVAENEFNEHGINANVESGVGTKILDISNLQKGTIIRCKAFLNDGSVIYAPNVYTIQGQGEDVSVSIITPSVTEGESTSRSSVIFSLGVPYNDTSTHDHWGMRNLIQVVVPVVLVVVALAVIVFGVIYWRKKTTKKYAVDKKDKSDKSNQELDEVTVQVSDKTVQGDAGGTKHTIATTGSTLPVKRIIPHTSHHRSTSLDGLPDSYHPQGTANFLDCAGASDMHDSSLQFCGCAVYSFGEKPRNQYPKDQDSSQIIILEPSSPRLDGNEVVYPQQAFKSRPEDLPEMVLQSDLEADSSEDH